MIYQPLLPHLFSDFIIADNFRYATQSDTITIKIIAYSGFGICLEVIYFHGCGIGCHPNLVASVGLNFLDGHRAWESIRIYRGKCDLIALRKQTDSFFCEASFVFLFPCGRSG